MTREERIQALRQSFQLQSYQKDAPGNVGYNLIMEASLQNPNLAESYKVQLCGIDPLTGQDVAESDHVFSFDAICCRNESKLLQYHGRFTLRCSASFHGEEFPIRDYELNLKYDKHKPYVCYSVAAAKNGFRHVRVRSNCWAICRNHIWLSFDGHKQRVNQPVTGGVMEFYIAAAEDITLSIYNLPQFNEMVVSKE